MNKQHNHELFTEILKKNTEESEANATGYLAMLINGICSVKRDSECFISTSVNVEKVFSLIIKLMFNLFKIPF